LVAGFLVAEYDFRRRLQQTGATVAAPMPREPPVIKVTLLERERETGMETSFTFRGGTCKRARNSDKYDKVCCYCQGRRDARSDFNFAHQQSHQHPNRSRCRSSWRVHRGPVRECGRRDGLFRQHVSVGVGEAMMRPTRESARFALSDSPVPSKRW